MCPFWVFYAATLVAFGLFAFIGTNFNALAMDPLGHVAGTASSVVSSLQTLLGGVLGALVGLAYDGTVLPLSLGFLVMSLASFAIIALTERGRLFGRREVAAARRRSDCPNRPEIQTKTPATSGRVFRTIEAARPRQRE